MEKDLLRQRLLVDLQCRGLHSFGQDRGLRRTSRLRLRIDYVGKMRIANQFAAIEA